MIAIAAFEAQDLASMTVQPAQADLHQADRYILGTAYARGGRAFTARDRSTGAILACGGAFALHDGHATMWSALSPAAGPAMLAITRRTQMVLRSLRHARIDAYVGADHGAARVWMRLLGFELEARLGAYWPDGSDVLVYRWGRG